MRAPSTVFRNPVNLLAAGLAAGLTLAGCSSSSGSQAQGNPKDVTLVLSANDIHGGKNGAEADWITNTLIPQFVQYEAGKGVTAHVSFQANGVDDAAYKSKLALDLQSGSGPDLFAVDGIWVGEFAEAGYIQPLADVVGPTVNDWDGWAQIPQSVQANGEFNAKRYAVPNGTDGRVLFFNKKLFAQAGLPADWQPTSWQDILDAGAKLKALPGVTPIQLDAGVPMGEATTTQGFLPLLAGAGGNLFNGKWLAGNTQPVKDVLGFYQKIYGGGLGDPILQQDAQGRNKSFAAFSQGKIGIYLESDYLWRSIVNPTGGTNPMSDRNDTVGYALIPAETPGMGLRHQDFVSYSGGSDWTLNPKTRFKQAAWDLLTYMNSADVIKSRLGGALKITARNDVNTQVLASDPMLKFVNDKVLPITFFRPSQAMYNDVSSAIQKATAEIVAGKSVDDASADYEKALEGIVGEEITNGTG